MDWNSSTRSSWLCTVLVAIPVVLWSLPLFHCTSRESRFGLYKHYLCNKYTLFTTFGYPWTFLARMCGTIDPGQPYDEYLVLAWKLGMTRLEKVSWGFHGNLYWSRVFFLAPIRSGRWGGQWLGRFVIPRFEIAGTKPPYVCPGCFIHTYSNNMINRFHVH
jgi:hypothetical protein